MRYPIGIQSFSKLREADMIYIDKTAFIAKLVSVPGNYFLSRPRRFGKSLLLTTLEAYFRGQRELFDGLAIANDPTVDWQPREVLRLDFGAGQYDNIEFLNQRIHAIISRFEDKYGSNPSEQNFSDRFAGCVRRAYEQTNRQVVVLIDEYDNPLLGSLTNQSLNDEVRAILKSVYGILKTCDSYIYFALITGVSRFSHVSIFSDLNNLNDISMDDEYAAICGITDEEMDTIFHERIDEWAGNLNVSYEQLRADLRLKYDGYRFSVNGPNIYNPFSLLTALSKCKLESYWSTTGTPTFVVELLKRRNLDLSKLNGDIKADISELNDFNVPLNFVAVMYQTGYLTIKDYKERSGTYTLGFPNAEVQDAFLNFLTRIYYSTIPYEDVDRDRLMDDIYEGRVDEFMRSMRSIIASIPCETSDERMLELHYRNMLWLVFRMCGCRTTAERAVMHGRIDLVIETPDLVYLFEIKRHNALAAAAEQIVVKDYAAAYETDPRRLIRVAVSIDDTTHNISNWTVLT